MPLKSDYPITGLILAGGQSRRMGADKALLTLANGQALLEQTAQRLKPQVTSLLISSNNPAHTISDIHSLSDTPKVPPHSGPLAGILTALHYLHQPQSNQPTTPQWLLTVAVDTPLFPKTLAQDLLQHAQTEQCPLVCAASKDKLHPTCALWHTSLCDKLERYLTAGERRLMGFHQQAKGQHHSYSTSPHDPFFNCNTPEDFQQLADVL